MTISKDATYTTRSGLPVRIYAVDGDPDYGEVHGAYLWNGKWISCDWGMDGQTRDEEQEFGSSNFDLVPITIREPREGEA